MTAESDSTSTSLIVRVQSHEQTAWDRLVTLYGPLIYYWARQAGLRPEDAADVAQEVFRSVATGIGRFRKDRPGDTFRGWLRTITGNKIRDHYRAQARQARAPGGTDAQRRLEDVAESEPAVSDDSGAIADLLHRALQQIRSDFSEQTWQAFTLAALHDRRSHNVAAELGMTPNAVRKAKARVLRRLREELCETP